MQYLLQPESRTMKIEDEIVMHNITKHKLDDMRARFIGLLEGDLKRHLDTIQTCLNMEPPRIAVAIERVETIQAIIKRQLDCIK
jgi:capsule polysaccharide export protein KpsE/RkpR